MSSDFIYTIEDIWVGFQLIWTVFMFSKICSTCELTCVDIYFKIPMTEFDSIIVDCVSKPITNMALFALLIVLSVPKRCVVYKFSSIICLLLRKTFIPRFP